jgi:hypothetical protein
MTSYTSLTLFFTIKSIPALGMWFKPTTDSQIRVMANGTVSPVYRHMESDFTVVAMILHHFKDHFQNGNTIYTPTEYYISGFRISAELHE